MWFVLPLACIPAACWSLGLALSGGGVARDRAVVGLAQIIHSGTVVFFGTLLSVFLLFATLLLLAPLFACRREWRRVLQVAAYSCAPVFLAGVVLVLPDLAYAVTLAVMHSLYLQYGGVRHVLGVKDDEAAEYVALAVMLLIAASTLAGAAGSWLGVI